MKIPAGMPGILQYAGFLMAPPASLDPKKPQQGGSYGIYKVAFTLFRPGYPLMPEGSVATFESLEGDSHIAPPSDTQVVLFHSQTEDGYFEFRGYPNSRGFLGKVIFEQVKGDNAQDARTKAYRALASTLSNISIQLDMPLAIYQSEMIELSNGNRFMSIISPYLERPMQITPNSSMSKEFRAHASLYREALNSNTPVFQFLCYFKIIEAIQDRRERLVLAAKASAAELPRIATQILPGEESQFIPWLNLIYESGRPWDFLTLESIFVQEARGKKLNRVVEDHLRPIRVRIAHAVLNSGELTLSADEEMDVRQVYKWLPLAKCIARQMLRSDFPDEFLPWLNPARQT